MAPLISLLLYGVNSGPRQLLPDTVANGVCGMVVELAEGRVVEQLYAKNAKKSMSR